MAKENRNGYGAKASSSSKYILAGIISVIAVFIYYFWAVPYRAALSYREQLQLFQTTDTYFNSLAGRPGGPAAYIGEFLTQFFNDFRIGAAVMSGLMTLFLMLCYLVNRKFAPSIPKFINLSLSIIPLLSLFLFFGNPDVTLTFMIAIIVSAAGTYLFTIADFDRRNAAGKYQPICNKTKRCAITYLLMIAGTSLLYWLAGPASVIFTLTTTAYICTDREASFLYKAIYATVAVECLAANIYAWSCILTYLTGYQLIGIGYMMIPDMVYAGQIIVAALCVVVPVLAVFFARIPQKVAVPILAAVEILAIIFFYPKSYDRTTYRLIDYDYMVRTNNWKGILDYSDKHDPDLPLSVSATNLAAGMTELLDCTAFHYRQHGAEGLIPPFVKETLSSWTTGEIFFQLGMINSAQRFYFEGMEAIPNYNKSGRAIKRLAETAIIRGEYSLAKKYLAILENTIFYKKWAQRNLDLLNNPEAVDKHPLYGSMRKKMIDEDYLFSEGELDKTLGQLYLKDSGNNLAKQYLILYPLLQRDLNKFAQYMGVVAETQPSYNPLLAQQALAFISMKNGQPIPKNIVPPAVEQSLRNFAQAWTSKNPSLLEPYRRTLFHYLLSQE